MALKLIDFYNIGPAEKIKEFIEACYAEFIEALLKDIVAQYVKIITHCPKGIYNNNPGRRPG